MKLKNKLQKTRKRVILIISVCIIAIAFLFLILSNHLIRIRKDHVLQQTSIIQNNI